MATPLAATTHAPIMSTLMICETTGEYQLLPGLLIACVIASVVISRTLHRDSIYRQHTRSIAKRDIAQFTLFGARQIRQFTNERCRKFLPSTSMISA